MSKTDKLSGTSSSTLFKPKKIQEISIEAIEKFAHNLEILKDLYQKLLENRTAWLEKQKFITDYQGQMQVDLDKHKALKIKYPHDKRLDTYLAFYQNEVDRSISGLAEVAEQLADVNHMIKQAEIKLGYHGDSSENSPSPAA